MWAAGVLPLDVICAHFITQLVILIIQGGLVLLFALVVFKLPLAGNILFESCSRSFIISMIIL